MSNFDLHEFNILSQRHNYFMTNNRINGFPVLKDSSIFLQKILAQRTSNSSEKKIPNNLLNQNDFEGFKTNKMRIYQSPDVTNTRINTDNNFNIESIKPNNNRKINAQNVSIISPQRSNIGVISLSRIITPTYYKIPINSTNRLSKSPDIAKTFNINNKLNEEVKVLNIGGKKFFATNSFNGLKSNTQANNTPKKLESSELFRNYNALKKKRDEVFKRKMKRDSSMYRKELLKKQKDKEIKEQSLNNNFINNNDKLRIIPLKKKLINSPQNRVRLNNNDSIAKNKTINNNDNDDNTKNKSHNIILLQKSKNLYCKKKFKTNNIFISKNLKNKEKPNNNININNNSKINQKIKDNLEYFRIKNDKSKVTINSPDRNINLNNLPKNKKFVEDYNPNLAQIIYSNDRKISIKINVLKDKNMTFPKEKNKKDFQKNLEIQKLISIFYKCSKRNNLNEGLIKNKKMVKRIKNINNMNTDILFSIKEDEEKTKQDNSIQEIEDIINKNKKIEKLTINEKITKEKERPVSSFSGGVRSRYLNRLHKK